MASFQKKLAAKILKVGMSKVWLDPNKVKDVEKAITRIDVKKLVNQNAVKALPGKLKMPKEKRKRRSTGGRKGSKFALWPKKRRWIHTVRPLRAMLKELKTSTQIDNSTYKKMRLMVKGGMFRSKHHLRIYLEQHDFLKKVGK
ncbi:MAG: 50S ribosomal protein L19e [Candidatus Aenigmarchaeota archaeon]|nr:50S ribosomal protein L19e [Candidatus Aenigmarchaeota archaeon]